MREDKLVQLARSYVKIGLKLALFFLLIPWSVASTVQLITIIQRKDRS